MQIKSISLKKVSYICLYTSNIEESIRFYRDILGLKPSSNQEISANTSFYSFNTGETTLALEKKGVRKMGLKDKSENPILLQFEAETPEKLEEISIWLEQNNIILFDRSKQTDYGLITNFCDPDGNKLEIIC